MAKYLKIYGSFVRNCFHRETMFRFNFFANLFTVVFGYIANILFFTFIYDTGIEEISGWNRYEIYILLATVWIIDAIFGGVFFFNLIKIPASVKNYDLDAVLTKPVDPIFMISVRRFNFGLFSGVFFGVAFLAYAIQCGKVSVGIEAVICYTFSICCAVLLLYSVFLIMVTFSLRFVRIQGLIQMFWVLMDVGKKPYSIYPRALSLFFTLLMPSVVVYNMPTQILTGEVFLDLSRRKTNVAILLLITATWVYVAITYFRKSLKYYYR